MIKLYDENPYLSTCDARVLSCERAGDDVWAVVLDRTCFFPEAGGQVCDTGWIKPDGGDDGDSIPVRDVQIDDDGVITHYCDSPVPKGDTVRISIDFERRHVLMQHHSGEHIFSGLVYSRFGYRNVGFHLSDRICTMDYSGVLDVEAVTMLEVMANEWIYRNVPIVCGYPGEEKLADIEYRCKGELKPPIRIVTIGDGEDIADCCACCAPHVRATGEIGILKVIGAQSWKGGTRLTIVCGRRALSDYQYKHNTIHDLGQILSVPDKQLIKRLNETLEARDQLRAEVAALQNRILDVRIGAVPDHSRDALIFMDDGLSLGEKTIRFAVNRLMESREGLCGIFHGNDEGGYRFILGSSVTDVRGAAKKLRDETAAKCGGSKQMIQGTIPSSKQKILDCLVGTPDLEEPGI